jgi:hypothetical protein
MSRDIDITGGLGGLVVSIALSNQGDSEELNAIVVDDNKAVVHVAATSVNKAKNVVFEEFKLTLVVQRNAEGVDDLIIRVILHRPDGGDHIVSNSMSRIIASDWVDVKNILFVPELWRATDLDNKLGPTNLNSNLEDVTNRGLANQSNQGPVDEEGPASSHVQPSSMLIAREDDGVLISSNQFSTRRALLFVVDACTEGRNRSKSKNGLVIRCTTHLPINQINGATAAPIEGGSDGLPYSYSSHSIDRSHLPFLFSGLPAPPPFAPPAFAPPALAPFEPPAPAPPSPPAPAPAPLKQSGRSASVY